MAWAPRRLALILRTDVKHTGCGRLILHSFKLLPKQKYNEAVWLIATVILWRIDPLLSGDFVNRNRFWATAR
jgi:hypothetical protein